MLQYVQLNRLLTMAAKSTARGTGRAGALPQYDPLMDPNLRHYFSNVPVQKQLVRAGLIDSDGRILDIKAANTKNSQIAAKDRLAQKGQEALAREEQELRERVRAQRLKILIEEQNARRIALFKEEERIRNEILKLTRETAAGAAAAVPKVSPGYSVVSNGSGRADAAGPGRPRTLTFDDSESVTESLHQDDAGAPITVSYGGFGLPSGRDLTAGGRPDTGGMHASAYDGLPGTNGGISSTTALGASGRQSPGGKPVSPSRVLRGLGGSSSTSIGDAGFPLASMQRLDPAGQGAGVSSSGLDGGAGVAAAGGYNPAASLPFSSSLASSSTVVLPDDDDTAAALALLKRAPTAESAPKPSTPGMYARRPQSQAATGAAGGAGGPALSVLPSGGSSSGLGPGPDGPDGTAGAVEAEEH